MEEVGLTAVWLYYIAQCSPFCTEFFLEREERTRMTLSPYAVLLQLNYPVSRLDKPLLPEDVIVTKHVKTRFPTR